MEQKEARSAFGRTGLSVPKVVFGTSAFGNLYRAIPYEEKLQIASEWFAAVESPVVLDSAGKYGAGLALEMIGRTLRDLGRGPDEVIISNKLGWKRVPLKGPEPTFEAGVWHDIGFDAEQRIGSTGIIECWEQGKELLGGGYAPELVSVHDPDEYLAAAPDTTDRRRRFEDLLGAYRALGELRGRGEVAGVGVGAKDWKVIREITSEVDLDWVMFACSMTVYTHPPELVDYMRSLHEAGVAMINSAVFNAGFLIGGNYFDYRIPDPVVEWQLFEWRERFFEACADFGVDPADACIEFGLSVPGVTSIALNTSKPGRIKDNVESADRSAPANFWTALKDRGIVDPAYPYIG